MVSEGQSENMSLLIGKMLEFVSYVIQDIANPIVIIGGIMIALGFIFLALRIFLGKKIMKPVSKSFFKSAVPAPLDILA